MFLKFCKKKNFKFIVQWSISIFRWLQGHKYVILANHYDLIVFSFQISMYQLIFFHDLFSNFAWHWNQLLRFIFSDYRSTFILEWNSLLYFTCHQNCQKINYAIEILISLKPIFSPKCKKTSLWSAYKLFNLTEDVTYTTIMIKTVFV